jgi:outer membrane protein
MKRCFLVFLVILGSHFSYAQWTLQQCVDTAIERNIGLKRNSLGLEQTKLNQEQALGSFLPNLNGQVSHGYNWGQRIDPFTNEFATQRIQSNSLGLSTSVTLFSGLQNVNQYKKAQVDSRAQLLTFDYQRNQLALQVSVAYLNVLLTKELQSSTELTVNRTKQQVKRITDLVNAGNAAEGSLRDVEAQLFSDEASYISAGNNVQSAILDIAQLMQLTEQEQRNFIIKADVSSFNIAEQIPDLTACVQNALATFPQIKSAELSLASSNLNLSIAKGGMSPRLNMSYSYGSGYSGASKVLTGSPDSLAFPIGQVFGSNQYVFSFPQAIYSLDDYATKPFGNQLRDNVNQSLFFSLTLPIFNGFSNDVAIKRAQLTRADNELTVQQTKVQLEQEVRKAYLDVTRAKANYEATDKAVEASRLAFDWNELRFNQGVVGMSEYLDARNRLQQAESNFVRSKYDWIFKRKIIDFYMGVPLMSQP